MRLRAAIMLSIVAVAGWTGARAAEVASVPCAPGELPSGAQCFSLEVPENRGAAGGRAIALYIMKLPAEQKARGALFIFQGGPGQAATKLAGFYAETYATARREFDIVLIDQRGTGRSNGLTCTFAGSDANPQGYLADIFEPAIIRGCKSELESRAELGLYTTAAAADDAEAVRRAFGYELIDIYGTSYGTRLALEYARRNPTHVRTLTLKGVVPPRLTIPTEFATDVERSLRLMLRACAREPACAQAFPNLVRELAAVTAKLDAGAVPVKLPAGNVTLTRGIFAATVRSMLQSTGTRAELPMLIHAAASGDFAPITARIMELRKLLQSEIATGLMLSVTCSEEVPNLDLARARAAARGTLLGSYWLDQFVQACRIWDVPAAETSRLLTFTLAVPALLISGDLDPATPPHDGEAALAHLARAKHVVVPGASHSFSGLKGCADLFMSKFLLKGDLDGLDTSCTAGIAAPPFKTQ